MSQVSEVLFSQSPLHSCLQAYVAYLVFALFFECLAEKCLCLGLPSLSECFDLE